MGSPWPMALLWDLARPTIVSRRTSPGPRGPLPRREDDNPANADGWPRLAAAIATWDAEGSAILTPAGRRMMDSRGASGNAWFVFPRTLTPALGNSAYFP